MSQYILITVVLFSLSGILNAQVYYNNQINYFNIEITPSILSSEEKNNNLEFLYHQNLNKKQPLIQQNIFYSKLFKNEYTGFGMGLSSAHYEKGNYRYQAGFGLAYRLIVFNYLYLRTGFYYKLIAASPNITSFQFYNIVTDQYQNRGIIHDRLNLSVSLSSTLEEFYISYSYLNGFTFINTNREQLYPSNHVITLGDLSTLFSTNQFLWSFALMSKSETFSHIVFTDYMQRFVLSRKTSLYYGLRAGLDKKHYFISPALEIKSEDFTVKLSGNIIVRRENLSTVYGTAIQLSFIYKLYNYENKHTNRNRRANVNF